MLPYVQGVERGYTVQRCGQHTLLHLPVGGYAGGLRLVELGLQLNHLHVGYQSFLVQRLGAAHSILGLLKRGARRCQRLTRVGVIHAQQHVALAHLGVRTDTDLGNRAAVRQTERDAGLLLHGGKIGVSAQRGYRLNGQHLTLNGLLRATLLLANGTRGAEQQEHKR